MKKPIFKVIKKEYLLTLARFSNTQTRCYNKDLEIDFLVDTIKIQKDDSFLILPRKATRKPAKLLVGLPIYAEDTYFYVESEIIYSRENFFKARIKAKDLARQYPSRKV